MQLLRKLSKDQGYLRGIALSPDGSLLAFAGTACEVQLWSITL